MGKQRIIEELKKNILGDILTKVYYVEEKYLFFFWKRKKYPFINLETSMLPIGFDIQYRYMDFKNKEDINIFNDLTSYKYRGRKIIKVLDSDRKIYFVNTKKKTNNGLFYDRKNSLKEVIKDIDSSIIITHKNTITYDL
jgi:hypothetical protein